MENSYGDSIIFKRNTDSEGNPVSIQLLEQKQVMDNHSCILLNQIPDESYGVHIGAMTEVYDIDRIGVAEYKVNYVDGLIYFNPLNIGKTFQIDYKGTGKQLIYCSRVASKLDKYGNVVETIEDLIEKGYEGLKCLELYGDARTVLERIEEDIRVGNAVSLKLEGNISVATPLQAKLDKNVVDANVIQPKLDKNVIDAKVIQPKLDKNVSDANVLKPQLEQILSNAQSDIAKIVATGNKLLTITIPMWVKNTDSTVEALYSCTLPHTMDSENLQVEVKDSITKMSTLPTYKTSGKSNIIFYTNVKIALDVILSASYYKATQTISDNIAEEVTKARGTDVSLLARLNKSDEQLEQKANSLELKKEYGINSKGRKKRAMITFSDDDGRKEVYTQLFPIIKEKNIPYSLAIVSSLIGTDASYMTKAQILEMQDFGVTFSCHGSTGPNFTTFTEDGLNNELQKWIKEMNTLGLSSNMTKSMTYPQGQNSELVRSVGSKYFTHAYLADNYNAINYEGIYNFGIGRVAFGSPHNDVLKQQLSSPYNTDTLEFYKFCVDEAIRTNSWMVFMSHAWFPTFNGQHLKDLVDYIKSKNVPIVDFQEGFDRCGNLLEIGDYVQGTKLTKNVFAVDCEGNLKSYDIRLLKDYNENIVQKATFNINLSECNLGTTYFKIPNSVSEGRPSGVISGGTIEVFKCNYAYGSDFSYMRFIVAGGTQEFIRGFNSDGTPISTWTKTTNDAFPTIPTKVNLSLTTNTFTVASKSTIDIDIDFANLKTNSYITGTPNWGTAEGIMVNIMCKANNKLTFRYYNNTASPISTNLGNWTIMWQ